MASHDPERLSRRQFSRGGDDSEVEKEQHEESSLKNDVGEDVDDDRPGQN